MADLVQTAANVLPSTGYTPVSGNSGAAIVAGNSVYQSNADQLWRQATSNGTQLQSGFTKLGVAVASSPGANQPALIWGGGTINLGATLVQGLIYCVSAAVAGNICPFGDLGAGKYTSILGVAASAALLTSPSGGPYASGITQ